MSQARLVALLLLGAMDTVRSADSGANARFQVRCAFAANFTEGTHVGKFKEWIYSDYCTKVPSGSPSCTLISLLSPLQPVFACDITTLYGRF